MGFLFKLHSARLPFLVEPRGQPPNSTNVGFTNVRGLDVDHGIALDTEICTRATRAEQKKERRPDEVLEGIRNIIKELPCLRFQAISKTKKIYIVRSCRKRQS